MSAENAQVSEPGGRTIDMVDLRLIEPAQNRRRVWRVTEQLTLFGEVELVIEWGRIGHKLRRRTESDPSGGIARRRAELLARRRRNGYLPVTSNRG